ncbi:MAG: hypothetical protein EA341_18970 [Mongoliibacter sp.]|uniref:hypothetical protein n=1 Tax=Mongoliibacter sp. TaxID=2022438 RepID=UPI0012EEF318|nr:hypothetical protein [Mongoliibacter sp.]TVP42932.1 MAG: hypothetical protein EA341_18970 [Mongoliibacter sp.]
MEIFTSLLILLTVYFLAVLGLIQGFIPGATKQVSSIKGEDKEVLSVKRVLLISFLLSVFVTAIMLYFFIFPNYTFA